MEDSVGETIQRLEDYMEKHRGRLIFPETIQTTQAQQKKNNQKAKNGRNITRENLDMAKKGKIIIINRTV